MPLDCHLFSDIREGLARNVAHSFFLPKDDPDKYDASTPHKIFESIRRTIKNGCPSEERIIQDIDRISEVTLDRIIAAEGTFIEDDGKKIRHGVREAAQKAAEAEAASAVAEEGKYSKMVDPRLVERFHQAIDQVLKKEIDVPLQFEADVCEFEATEVGPAGDDIVLGLDGQEVEAAGYSSDEEED